MYAAEGDEILIEASGSIEIITADGGRKKMPVTNPVSGEAQALIED